MRGADIVLRCAAPAVYAAACWFAGCSAEARYPVLAFFFDGVPPPGAAGGEGILGPSPYGIEGEGRPAVSQVKAYFHTPFARGQCNGCHPETRSLFLGEDKRSGLCYSCHEHDAFKARIESYAFVHGPVAAEACQVCHDPHESLYKGVLVSPDPKVCRDCHDILTGSSAPWHHSAVRGECLPCHDPHGGSNRFFVKEGKGAPPSGEAVKE